MIYLVKGRHRACAIAIKFLQAVGTGGDENQVRYFIWPYQTLVVTHVSIFLSIYIFYVHAKCIIMEFGDLGQVGVLTKSCKNQEDVIPSHNYYPARMRKG